MKSITVLQDSAAQIREQVPYLKMLVLFGSRARGDHREDSDYDFAALYDEEMRHAIIEFGTFSQLNIYSQVTNIFDLSIEKVDIVRLNEGSPEIAHVVSRDGLLIYEREVGEFEKFRQESLLSKQALKQLQQKTIEELRAFSSSKRKKYGN